MNAFISWLPWLVSFILLTIVAIKILYHLTWRRRVLCAVGRKHVASLSFALSLLFKSKYYTEIAMYRISFLDGAKVLKHFRRYNDGRNSITSDYRVIDGKLKPCEISVMMERHSSVFPRAPLSFIHSFHSLHPIVQFSSFSHFDLLNKL